MKNDNSQESSSTSSSTTSTLTATTSVKNNNQKAKTDNLTDVKGLSKHTDIKAELQQTNTEDIKTDDNLVNELYDKVFQSLNSEYTEYKKEQEEKNKSWWQSVKDAFNRGKAEGNGGVKGFFKGCWEATKTGWSKAPTWAKVGVGAGIMAAGLLSTPLITAVNYMGAGQILQTLPAWLLSNPKAAIMVLGGAHLAVKDLAKTTVKYMNKLNMTEEEKKWHDVVHDNNGKVIDKKRAFLLFLISRLNNNKNYFFHNAGECFDAIKKAEDKEREKNNNINLIENEISQPNSQTIEHSNNKIKLNKNNNNIAEKESKNNVNNSKTNNKNNEAYHKEIKEINNDSKFGKDDINEKEIKGENINEVKI